MKRSQSPAIGLDPSASHQSSDDATKRQDEPSSAQETASGIPVWCAFDELAEVSALKPHPENTNRHPEEGLQKLVAIIRANGWRSAVIVSRLSGYVIKGHGRIAAAKLAGWDRVPISYQEYADAEAEMSDLLADNLASDLSVMDKTALIGALGRYSIDSTAVGLTDRERKALKRKMSAKLREVQAGTVFEIVIICRDESHQASLLTKFTEEGHECKALIF